MADSKPKYTDKSQAARFDSWKPTEQIEAELREIIEGCIVTPSKLVRQHEVINIDKLILRLTSRESRIGQHTWNAARKSLRAEQAKENTK